MLQHLLKYNLRVIYRHLIVFYSIMIACAILGRLLSHLDDNIMIKFFHEFFNGASLGLCIGVLINNVTHIWAYTKQDFYGDPSYLTHTLPVPRRTLYLAKLYTVIITLFTTIAVIASVLLIDYGTATTFSFINQLIQNTGSTAEFITFVAVSITLIFLEFIFLTQIGLVGIIFGHRSASHRTFKTIVYSLSCFVGFNLLSVVLIELWGLADPEVANLVNNNFLTNSAMLKLLVISNVLYLVYIGITSIINIRSLESGIDVD